MILVTLGTQDKVFPRLLEAIDKAIEEKIITERVVVQAGNTKYESNNMEIFSFIPYEEFNDMINQCDILITHAGVGSIITGINHNKKVIATARLKKYGEHANDHQLQILDTFEQSGYILALRNFEEIGKVLQEAKAFKTKGFQSNTSNVMDMIGKFIENNC